MIKGTPKDIGGIDILKIFAALLIVALHSELILSLNTKFHTQLFMIFARMAVPLFFISSSFLLARHISMHHDQQQAVSKYVKRVSRLYLFWLVLYGYFIVKATEANMTINGWSIQNFAWGLLRCLLSGPKTMLLGWYLNASLFGVLFVYYWFKKHHYLGVALALISFILVVIFSGYYPLQWPLQVQTSIFVGPIYFYLGKLLFWWFEHKPRVNYWMLAGLTMLVFCLAWWEIHVASFYHGNNDQLFTFPLLASLLFLLFLYLPIKLPYAHWWRNLTSFMYLSHYLLMKIFYNFLYFQIHSVAQRYLIIVGLVLLSYSVVSWLQRYNWAKILRNAF
ncbi:MAG: acyltransferase [Lactobacillus sp.]|nr:acyltransferase [Lactobacillus sp.]